MKRKPALSIRETAVFALLGTVMYVAKVIMEFMPNVHPIAMLTVAYTLVYRSKALIPLYLFVFLCGLFNGFHMWWLPYLYIWLPLWGAAMLMPGKMSAKAAVPACCAVCSVHGMLFGTLYAPAQALMYGLNFKATVTWIIAGLPWDAVHAAGNLCMGLLTVPIANALKAANRLVYPK